MMAMDLGLASAVGAFGAIPLVRWTFGNALAPLPASASIAKDAAMRIGRSASPAIRTIGKRRLASIQVQRKHETPPERAGA